MPCNSDMGGPRDWSRDEIQRIAIEAVKQAAPQPAQFQASPIEAILCGILTAHGLDLFDKVDWVEVGVPEAVARAWWVKHQALDQLREADELLQNAIKANVP